MDAEGVFNSSWFKEEIGKHATVLYPSVGEAHWQTGIVEKTYTHTRLFAKLQLDEVFAIDQSTQQILDATSTPKNTHGVYGRYTPYQWVAGRPGRHPLIDAEFVPPIEDTGNLEDPFVAHLKRKVTAAAAFQREEARSLLRLAKKARTRQPITVSPGDIVYYWRSSQNVNKR